MKEEEIKDTLLILEDTDISRIELAENVDLRTYQLAVNNLLSLYQEQKQLNEIHQKINGELRVKVKELENADLTVVYLDGVYDGKNKYKNKIKEKIEEVKNSKENYTFSQVTSEDIRRTIITNLKELLGE